MRKESKLEKRQGEILGAIVRLFVSTGVPVGSKVVAEYLREPLSSATIRNEMAELEDAEKNRLSHRALAIIDVLPRLLKLGAR